MNAFFLRIIGLPAEDAASVSGGALRFSPMVAPTVIAAVAVLLAIISWLAYRSTPSDVPAGRRRIMALLRTVFFVLLLGLLLRPMIALTLDREQRRTIAVLVDGSASMGIADPRETPADRAREAIATGALAPDAGIGSAPSASTGGAAIERAAIASASLGNQQLALLESLGEGSDLIRYSFGGSLGGPDDAENPDLPETAIGNALADVLRRHSADDLGAVVLVTDGANNEGRSPIAVAEALRERGVKVFSYGVGVTGSRDIAIDSLDLPSVALAEDAVPVAIRIKHRGLIGERARVVVTLAGAEAGAKEIELDGTGNQVVTIPVVPGKAGEFDIEARVETVGGEVLEDNNSLSQGLRVMDSAIRVLMVESSPRWEFKYIQAMLLREQRVELKCFLADVDPAVARISGGPYLEEFPERREDLFGYDLIIFGDIDPDDIPKNTPENLAAYVSDGGGSLAILAGKRFTPQAYRNTEIERLLPIELGATRLGGDAILATRPIQLELTDAGRNTTFLNLEEDPDLADARWARLPPIYWIYGAERAKPAAETYLIKPSDQTPVVALQRYGAGEVLWVGTDNTWRWRRNTGDLYHTRFWGQVVQRLAGRRLAAGSRRTDMRSDRAVVREGERFTVFARLLDSSFEPRDDETVLATLEGRGEGDAAGSLRQVSLRAVPGSPGFYRAEFPAGDKGRYRLSVNDDAASSLDLSVRGADREFAETALDERMLREISEVTGGQFLREEDLYKLPDLAKLKPTKISVIREAELWNSPIYFILLLLPLTIEWFMRKFSELK